MQYNVSIEIYSGTIDHTKLNLSVAFSASAGAGVAEGARRSFGRCRFATALGGPGWFQSFRCGSRGYAEVARCFGVVLVGFRIPGDFSKFIVCLFRGGARELIIGCFRDGSPKVELET